MSGVGEIRPGEFCHGLLLALEASEGRRRRRKRNTTPDAIGLGIKRALLEAAVRDDPDPASFEAWLMQRCGEARPADGAVHAMALTIWDEWRLLGASTEFRAWVAGGAPSDDRDRSAAPARRIR